MIEKHILIVDDDIRICELLKQFLNKNNFFTSIVFDVKKAKEKILKYNFDLMVIDLMMPEESGIDFLKFLNQNQIKIPTIILTALDDIDNKTICFELGCNDYLVKPFEPKELILRINNILNKKQDNNFCIFSDFLFDFNKQVLTKNNKQIQLTTIQTNLLNLFCKNINKILTREELIENKINERSIDVSIARLRKKIEIDNKNPKFLRTIRNKGYILNN